MSVEEDNLPPYVDFYRDWEDKPLREIDSFFFFAGRKGESLSSIIEVSRLVALEDIASSENEILGRGIVKSQNREEGPDVAVQLAQVVEWSVEFGSTEAACGVWVRTVRDQWYRLLSPRSNYEPLYRSLRHKFSITTKLFFVMYEDVTADFEEIIRKVGLTEAELVKEAEFVCGHLRSDPILKRSPFIREFTIKQRIEEQKNPRPKTQMPKKRGRPRKTFPVPEDAEIDKILKERERQQKEKLMHAKSSLPQGQTSVPAEKQPLKTAASLPLPKTTIGLAKHAAAANLHNYPALQQAIGLVERDDAEKRRRRHQRKMEKSERREKKHGYKEDKKRTREEKARLKALGKLAAPNAPISGGVQKNHMVKPSPNPLRPSTPSYPPKSSSPVTPKREKTLGELRAEEDHASTLSYKGLSFNTLKNLPRMALNAQGRLQCYICQKTYSRTLLKDFIDHLHKHRTSLLGAMSERERTSLRLLSFLNQLRVRAFIESELAIDRNPSSGSREDTSSLVFAPWPSLPKPMPVPEAGHGVKRKLDEVDDVETSSVAEKKLKVDVK